MKPNKEGIKFTTDRDPELENIAGNLMIAQYPVDKLRNRLSEQIRFIGYGYFGSEKTSAHTFKNNGSRHILPRIGRILGESVLSANISKTKIESLLL